MTASDESLFRASASGDSAAFSELYERHARTIYNYLFRRLADWSEAEDLTAVVFLEAFRRRNDVVVTRTPAMNEEIHFAWSPARR